MQTKAQLLAQVMEKNLANLSIGMATPPEDIAGAIHWLRNPPDNFRMGDGPVVRHVRYMFSWQKSPQGAEFWSCVHKVLTSKLGVNYLYRGE